MKCVNCKNCVNYKDGYYYCQMDDGYEAIEECIANDDNMECDFYIDDVDVDD